MQVLDFAKQGLATHLVKIDLTAYLVPHLPTEGEVSIPVFEMWRGSLSDVGKRMYGIQRRLPHVYGLEVWQGDIVEKEETFNVPAGYLLVVEFNVEMNGILSRYGFTACCNDEVPEGYSNTEAIFIIEYAPNSPATSGMDELQVMIEVPEHHAPAYPKTTVL